MCGERGIAGNVEAKDIGEDLGARESMSQAVLGELHRDPAQALIPIAYIETRLTEHEEAVVSNEMEKDEGDSSLRVNEKVVFGISEFGWKVVDDLLQFFLERGQLVEHLLSGIRRVSYE